MIGEINHPVEDDDCKATFLSHLSMV